MKVIFISQFAVYRLQMFNFLLVGRWAGSGDLGTPEIFRTLKKCNNNFCGQLVIHQLAGVFCMHIVRTYVQGEQGVCTVDISFYVLTYHFQM